MDLSSFFSYPSEDGASRAGDLVFLGDLGDDDWERLLSLTQVSRFSAGEIVVRQGDAQRTLYIVGTGQLEVVAARSGAAEGARIAVIDAGSVFGEQAFFDGQPRSATVRAVTECELMALHHEAFETLAASEPRLAQLVLMDLGRILSLRLRARANAQVRGGGP